VVKEEPIRVEATFPPVQGVLPRRDVPFHERTATGPGPCSGKIG